MNLLMSTKLYYQIGQQLNQAQLLSSKDLYSFNEIEVQHHYDTFMVKRVAQNVF